MSKKESKKDAFDLEEALSKVEKPIFFVEGFKEHIENNNLKIKSEKEFEKLLNEFKELSL